MRQICQVQNIPLSKCWFTQWNADYQPCPQASGMIPALVSEKFVLLLWNWSPSKMLQQSLDPVLGSGLENCQSLTLWKIIKHKRMILRQNLFIEVITTIRRFQLVKNIVWDYAHFNPCFNLSNDVHPVCIRKHVKKGMGNKYLQEHAIY